MQIRPKRNICFVVLVNLLLPLISLISNAQVIKGTVTDANTGEPLVGATVHLDGTKYFTLVKLDGTFTFTKLPSGANRVVITSKGYKSASAAVVDYRPLMVLLHPTAEELESININAPAGNDKGARRLEKIADPVLNVLSSKTLQLLPDITVANAIQRVSGVTIEKSSSGEGRYPIIRGMEKRYINTLVNGIKIPSPDNKSRFIPLDLFSSELLERLEVSKSLTPSMEGDAIGGTINIVMKDAPASRLFQVNAALGYNTILHQQPFQKFDKSSMNKQSPAEINGSTYLATPKDFSVAHLNYAEKKLPINSTFGLTFGDRFGKNKKFGFIISASYQDISRGTKSNFFLPNSQPGLENIPLFSDLQLRYYSSQSQRKGINAKFDYQLNPDNKISLTNTFVRLDDYQARFIFDTVALNSLVNNQQRSTWQYQSIYNATLQGLHRVNPSVKIDWSLVFSEAGNHVPDQSEFTHQYAIVATNLTADKLQSMTRTWAHNTDRDYSGYLNISKEVKIFTKPLEIKIGGLIRHKERNNFYNSYSLDPQLNAVYTTINKATFIFNPVSSGVPSISGNNYVFTEKVNAAYLQGKWKWTSKLEILGGLRVEYTSQDYGTQLSKDVNARSGNIKYPDYLPSIQFKYAVTNNQNVRLAYYKALARPGFAELVPDGPDGEFFKERGDPTGLKHSYADNLDLRYEMYPGGAGQVLLGIFYKNIQDPIEISAVKPLNVNSLYLQPVNIGRATNYGFEAVVTKYFGAFGISANYTYTKSSITNDSMITSFRNNSGAIVSKRVSETRPLQGQSNHVGNISLIYKNPGIGLDIQLALVYTGERINFISPYLGLHYWQSPTTQLDFSFEKRLIKKFTVYGKVNNLTDAPYELSLHQPYKTYLQSSGSRGLALQSDPDKKIIIQKDFYRISYLFGLRYKF